jgi:hypothetical protein
MMHFRAPKATSMAVLNFTPGPDGAGTVEMPDANPVHGRLRSGMTLAAPMQQFTPDQEYFRKTGGNGRWGADANVGAHAPVNAIRQNEDGCTDTVKLEPVSADGVDYYMDMGGKGGVDWAARRP